MRKQRLEDCGFKQLESTVIEKLKSVPGAIYVDPELIVTHRQSHGFWNTFAVHFHNGRATGGFSNRPLEQQNLLLRHSIKWAWIDAVAHLQRTVHAFRSGSNPFWSIPFYLLLVLPLIATHAAGEVVGYYRGPGDSAHYLV